MELKREKNRIAIYLDNVEAGEITYYEDDNNLVVDHTFVDPVHRGKNFALLLVDDLVDYARSRSMKIIPVCPYVVKVLNRDDKYKDILGKR